MKLWRRASALLKDKNSIYLAKLARKTAYRNSELETAIIKATSHDETRIDYKNAQRVFTWVRTSPSFIKPLIWSISTRMEKTRSWVVALKGLLLMHGIFCCKIPSVRRIGRLPFDLSNFYDGHSNSSRTFGLSAFVRAYFAFLDQKSAYDAMLFDEDQRIKRRDESSTVQVLVELQKLQALLDLLIQVKPYLDGIYIGLILEAMDCILIEIFDVYSRICNGIAGVLVGIFEANQLEAKMALKVLQKAGSQGEDLSAYFEFCKDIGVLNASEFPRVDQIPEEDIRDLEKIINGVSEKQKPVTTLSTLIEKSEKEEQTDSSKAIVVTDNWVTFDDEFKGGEKETSCTNLEKALIVNPFVEKELIVDPFVEKASTVDPFAASVNFPPSIVCDRPWHSRGYAYSNGCMQLDQYYCNATNQMGGEAAALSMNNNNSYNNNNNNNNVNQRNLILSL